ncbi:unnamed protein product [Gongylonema pulchrum]|uniref:ADAM_CR_2 domain-containing protein n=1 Tax=Gongylonema pulchrum TaxID=637853 RepID=A0A183E6D3_9BILA|nr:unnamed protein product [Gongylonema pulchrum]
MLGASWSSWGQWSGCSMSCGGCGVRRRIRACYGANQRGVNEDAEECGEKRCPLLESVFQCKGRLIVPCNLDDKLQLASDKSVRSVTEDKSLFSDPLKYKKRFGGSVAAFTGEQYCEKHFKYQCSPPLLTLHLNWKTARWTRIDERGCCNGFHFNGTACTRIWR